MTTQYDVPTTWTYDPDEEMDFGWKFPRTLEDDESIIAVTVEAEAGTGVVFGGGDGSHPQWGVAADGKSVTVWLTDATSSGELTCHVVTSAGRKYDDSVWLNVKEK